MPQHSGMSLLELLIVLAILSTIVAISWPAMSRPLARSRIQSAARQLQQELSGARLNAMESRVVQVFQYQPGSSTYYIGPEIRVNHSSDKSISAPRQAADIFGPPNSDGPARAKNMSENDSTQSQQSGESLSLTDGVCFAKGERISRLPAPITTRSGREVDRELRQVTAPTSMREWSTPVRFYPSGRVCSASLRLFSEDGYQLSVELEGLTGRIRITEMQPFDQLEADASGDGE